MKTCLNASLVNGSSKLDSNSVGGQFIMLGDNTTTTHSAWFNSCASSPHLSVSRDRNGAVQAVESLAWNENNLRLFTQKQTGNRKAKRNA